MPLYKVTLMFSTRENAVSPLSAVESIADYIEQECRHMIYDVEDEETGEKWNVDLDVYEGDQVTVNS